MAGMIDRARSIFTNALRVWANPQNSVTVPVGYRVPFYDRLWDYYSNEALGPMDSVWQEYKARNQLYRYTRLIMNPTRRLVEFYVGAVYPGVLTDDASQFPDGVPSAIPFPKDTDPRLLAAIAQFWQWSNWQSGKDIMVRYSAALGNCLVELVDDLQRRKVTAQVWWPGHVRELGIDATGNVIAYTLEYVVDPGDAEGETTGTQSYVYKKVVTKDTISYFKDGDPYDYSGQEGRGAVVPNPYGFVPAVWVKHFDMGDDFGQPVMWATLSKIDELNSVISMAHDEIAKIIKSPVVITAQGGTNRIDGKPDDTKEADKKRGRETMPIIHLPPGSGVQTIPLNLGETLQWVENLSKEIEADHPELSMYQTMRGMSTATGPAIARLMGDVNQLVASAEATYDQQSVKLFQMAIAIAGMRVNNGDWGNAGQLSKQQLKFRPFGLDSYQRGDLDFAIIPRPVVTTTQLEMWTTRKTQMEALTVQAALGFPKNYIMAEAGASDKQIQEWADSEQATVNDAGAALLNAFTSGSGMTPGPSANLLPAGSQNGLQRATGPNNG